MTLNVSVDRRRFLRKLGLGVVSLLGAAWLVSNRFPGVGDPIERLLSLVPDRRHTRRVGRALLRTHHGSVEIGSLMRSIIGDDWLRALATADDASLKDRLEEKRRHDFARERVVRFDGWVLAQSEVDLCLLSGLA